MWKITMPIFLSKYTIYGVKGTNILLNIKILLSRRIYDFF